MVNSDICAAARAPGRPILSYEFLPTKTDEAEQSLFQKTIPALRALNPAFCSVTYGAGGSTRDKTLGIVDRIQREHRITAMAHLTCVNTTADEIGGVLAQARALDIKNILALRGDPPNGADEFTPTDRGFAYSHELVRCVREFGGFSIGVAGFPEGHIACREGKFVDWERLKNKIECGADFVITQLFFDNTHYFALRDFLAQHGVSVPLLPGILPILSASQIKRFVALCGASLPAPLLFALERAEDDDAVAEIGIDYATRQCEELLREGAPGLHFYTLNRARSTTAVVKNLALDRLAFSEVDAR
jgi:methylenetetrahydrofolate reductase (NADPH)